MEPANFRIVVQHQKVNIRKKRVMIYEYFKEFFWNSIGDPGEKP
jgi:hypothetical protein